jgi:hypothetical protein
MPRRLHIHISLEDGADAPVDLADVLHDVARQVDQQGLVLKPGVVAY